MNTSRPLLSQALLAIACASILSSCSTPLAEQGRWSPLPSLEVTGKTRDAAQSVPVLDFCQPEAVRHILEKIEAESDIENPTREERILQILAFVQDLPLSNDPDDLWLTPGETLIAGGDCEDRSFLLSSLLAAADIDHWVFVGTFRDRPHTWVAVQEDDGNLRYLETLDKTARLKKTLDAYEPWGRWNPLTKEIEEWIPNPRSPEPPDEEPFPPTSSNF
jgi:hypothetical protein